MAPWSVHENERANFIKAGGFSFLHDDPTRLRKVVRRQVQCPVSEARALLHTCGDRREMPTSMPADRLYEGARRVIFPDKQQQQRT